MACPEQPQARQHNRRLPVGSAPVHEPRITVDLKTPQSPRVSQPPLATKSRSAVSATGSADENGPKRR